MTTSVPWQPPPGSVFMFNRQKVSSTGTQGGTWAQSVTQGHKVLHKGTRRYTGAQGGTQGHKVVHGHKVLHKGTKWYTGAQGGTQGHKVVHGHKVLHKGTKWYTGAQGGTQGHKVVHKGTRNTHSEDPSKPLVCCILTYIYNNNNYMHHDHV